jgi:signal transduction histidine kinase
MPASLRDWLPEDHLAYFISDVVDHINLISGERRPLSAEAEVALLRICQESLANVQKHAQANEVDIDLVFERAGGGLSIRDNG